MKRSATTPRAPSSTGEGPSLLSKAHRGLSGASRLKDDRVGHCLANPILTRGLYHARLHGGNSTLPLRTSMSAPPPHTPTGEAMKQAVEVHAAPLPPPPPHCYV